MTLTQESFAFLGWLKQATRRLLTLDRRTTTRLITSITINQFLTIIAFFLPLKVILLAGSQSVPYYFDFLITEETKDLWVGILAALTFIAFLISKYVDSLTTRYSGRGAQELLDSANQVPISSNEEELSESTYHKLCETSAKLIFALIALIGGLLLFPPLFLTLLAILLLEFAVAAYATSRAGSDYEHNRLHAYINTKPKDFLTLLQAINFFAVFIFLTLTFLVLDQVSFIIAIASIIISRQLFASIRLVVNNAIKLKRDRSYVDAILFPDSRLGDPERSTAHDFRFAFSNDKRLGRLRQLDESLFASVSESVWVDSGTDKIAMFDLYGPGGIGNGERLYREYVYNSKTVRGVEQHDYLLREMDADDVLCLPRVASYEDAGFFGRVVDYRHVETIDRPTYKRFRRDLLTHYWNLPIPPQLIQSFTNARLQLHERVHETGFAQLALAADEPWAQESYQQLKESLDALCERISKLPLVLINNDLSLRNIVCKNGQEPRLVNWTSWALEPLGVGFDPENDEIELLQDGADRARLERELPQGSPLVDVFCAGLLHRIEVLSRRGYPKKALSIAHDNLSLLGLSDDYLLAMSGTATTGTEQVEDTDLDSEITLNP